METSPFVSSLLHFGHHNLLSHLRPQKYTELEPSCECPIEVDHSLWAAGEAGFQIDDLLDLSNEEEPPSPSTIVHAEESPSSTDLHTSAMEISAGRSGEDEDIAGNEPESGLCVPPDELVSQLEWLSGFNEDNFFSGDTKFMSLSPHVKASLGGAPSRFQETPKDAAHKARDKFHNQSPVSVFEQSANSYACRHLYKPHRVRKARTGGRVWSLDILKPISTGSRLKVPTGTTGLLAATCASAYTEHLYMSFQHEVMERPFKKVKKSGSSVSALDSALVRRCSHCLVQKTPQWRAGPLGPKTLCNACGVRYKSGRLVPEYRPAASPTFVNEVHSNSHRRILEMRRAKEIETVGVLESLEDKVDGGPCLLGHGPSRALEAREETPSETSLEQDISSPLNDHHFKPHDDDDSSSQGSSSSCKLDMPISEKEACREGSSVTDRRKDAPAEQDIIRPRQLNSEDGEATIAGEELERVSLGEVKASKRHDLVCLESCTTTTIPMSKGQDTFERGYGSANGAEEQKGCKWQGSNEIV